MVGRVFRFHAAHNLEGYDGECERLHGHTYRLRVFVKGRVGENGIVVDFNHIREVVEREVISVLDHSYLNDILRGNSSLERLACWIWDRLKSHLNVCKIELWETDNNFLEYEGGRDG